MKPIVLISAGCIALVSAGAQAAAPKPPQPPKPPTMSQPAPFKPFKGTHVESNRGGVNSYPKPPKPKGGFSTY